MFDREYVFSKLNEKEYGRTKRLQVSNDLIEHIMDDAHRCF